MYKVYRAFVVVMLVVFAYILGGLSGFVVGYHDNYAEKVAVYRLSKYRR